MRIDSEILGQSILEHPEDLRAEEFLSGGEAWTAFREGRIDAATFGVHGTANWGPAEIRGNAIKDLAALNKVETLPWDEWGRMTASYNGETGADYDSLLDTITVTAADDDLHAIAELYAQATLLAGCGHGDLSVVTTRVNRAGSFDGEGGPSVHGFAPASSTWTRTVTGFCSASTPFGVPITVSLCPRRSRARWRHRIAPRNVGGESEVLHFSTCPTDHGSHR